MNTVKKQTSLRRPRVSQHRKRKAGVTRWSGDVTKRSHALDLEEGIFRLKDPKTIATALKCSAERSRHRKGTPYSSSMSMLNFYSNRAGKMLSRQRRDILKRSKDELRKVFGRA